MNNLADNLACKQTMLPALLNLYFVITTSVKEEVVCQAGLTDSGNCHVNSLLSHKHNPKSWDREKEEEGRGVTAKTVRALDVGSKKTHTKTNKSLHCHHQNGFCIKVGSDESHFNVSLTVRDKVTRQCPQTTTFEEKGEPKQIRTEVPLLIGLTPYS